MVKLEVGKYYKRRDGSKAGPIKKWLESGGSEWPFTCGHYPYDEIGRYSYDKKTHDFDLIEEWPDDPPKSQPTLSGETIDRIAIDSLRFHMADKDMEPLQLEAFRIVLRYYGVTV